MSPKAGKYTFEYSERVVVRSTTGTIWKIDLDELPDDGIAFLINVSDTSRPIGTVQSRLSKSHRSISFSKDSESVSIDANFKTDGSREITMKMPNHTFQGLVKPDGTLVVANPPKDDDGPSISKLQPLLKSVLEVHGPMTDFLQKTYQKAKSKDQCLSDYKKKIRKIGWDAIKDAATGAAACLAGVLGCIAGLGIVIGAIGSTSDQEQQALDEYNECTKPPSPA
jgi:hypothetical protein